MENDNFEYTNESQLLIEKMRRIKEEINENHAKGDKEGRDMALIDFVNLCNDETQDFDLDTAKQQRSCLQVLKNCI